MAATEAKQRGTLINILDLDDAEGAKGISFDPEVEYTFTITQREARQLETEKDGHKKSFTVIDVQCTELESQASIKTSFFYNNKVIINEEDKVKESPVVKFARGIGYAVGVGKKFKFADVLREGIVFKAFVKPQMGKDGKTPTGYSEIDLATVKSVSGAKKQATISGSSEDEAFLVSLALGYPNKEKLIGGLGSIGKMPLINLLITLDEQGKLKYMKSH